MEETIRRVIEEAPEGVPTRARLRQVLMRMRSARSRACTRHRTGDALESRLLRSAEGNQDCAKETRQLPRFRRSSLRKAAPSRGGDGAASGAVRADGAATLCDPQSRSATEESRGPPIAKSDALIGLGCSQR